MKKTLTILLAILCVQCCTICGEIFRGGYTLHYSYR